MPQKSDTRGSVKLSRKNTKRLLALVEKYPYWFNLNKVANTIIEVSLPKYEKQFSTLPKL